MNQKSPIISVAIVTLIVVALCAVCVSPLVSAASSGTTGAQSAGLIQASTSSIVGAPAASGPAVCSWGSEFHVFVQGADHEIYWKYWEGSNWVDWQSLGGYGTSDPAAVTWGSEKIAVFVRGMDGALWGNYYQTIGSLPEWSGWKYVGGKLAAGTGPAACSVSTPSFDIFVVGMDNALWHITWVPSPIPGPRGPWTSGGGLLTSSPAAVSQTAGVIDVFGRGLDGALWSRQYSTSTGWAARDWYYLGGLLVAGTGPGAATNTATGNLFAFVIGTDNAVWYKYIAPGGTWIGWHTAGGICTSSVAATQWVSGGGFYDVIAVRGPDSAVWIRLADTTSWLGGWVSIGSPA